MSFLNFSNVRYAAAPTGHARFAPPSSPAPTPGIQNGQTAVICPQSPAEWATVGAEFLSGLPLTGGPVPNYTEADIPPTDPRTSEDCLFLDVLVPTETFQKGAKAKAAVLVWIHGGGYIQGHKSEAGHGLGLVTTSKANGGPGIIYVAINYRLGLFVSQQP
jgi:cholinesterase